MNCYSQKVDKTIEPELKSFFLENGAVITPVQNALWRVKTPKYTATFYNTGKFLIQGADVSDIVSQLENILGSVSNTSSSLHAFF